MRTALTDMLGVDFPLVAFSHCRDVVATVTNSGGFGMLGAVRFTPDQLDEELSWLDRETHGRPYGVDVLIPTRLAGRDEGLSAGETAARVPAEHVEFEPLNVDLHESYRSETSSDVVDTHGIEPPFHEQTGRCVGNAEAGG